jgi:hypothetical protein
MSVASTLSITQDLEPEAAFYRDVLEVLQRAGVPVLVGGAYAMSAHTGIERPTKDLDLFLRRSDYERAVAAVEGAGYETALKFPHWLGKTLAGAWCVDLIFNSGNGLTHVDDAWFVHAKHAEVLGVKSRIVPVEEMIWSKALIMERERFDGADVAHLIRAQAATLDWTRLVGRMQATWRVLLSHLVLFGFIYPGERGLVPAWVMDRLLQRLHAELHAPVADSTVCRGTLLSREQYLHDVQRGGYVDGRLPPSGTMSPSDIALWTDAIAEDAQKTRRSVG